MSSFRGSNEMRGLFLDFDGVTHPVSVIEDWRTLNVHGADIPHLIQKRDLFRWMHILTEALEDHPDVLLVVHSGWRSVANNLALKQILGPSLADRFIGVTSLEMGRHCGIIDFAERSGMDHFMVIDDATHEFPKDFKNLIATDPELGLTDANVCRRLDAWLQTTRPTPSSNMCACLPG